MSNQTLPIINTTIEPHIDNRVVNYGASTIKIATPHTAEVVTDAARSNTRILRTPGHISRTVRDGTTPGDCDDALRSPRGNSPVLIVSIAVPPTRGRSGISDILNKWQYISPSISRNTQKFDTSVDGNLADDGDSTYIFGKVLGQELPDSISYDIYSRCRKDFTSNIVSTEAPNLVNLGLLTA